MKKILLIILLIIIMYELPCKLAENFQMHNIICNTAFMVEKTTLYKNYTSSYYLNRVLHEFVEMKKFYF